MKISSSFSKQDRNINSPSFKGVPPNPKYIPEFIGTLGKYAGEYIDSPEQRLFLALATIAFKPLIDLKYAEEDKKVDTALKSAAKGIAGGLTGVTIRSAFLKLTDKYIGYESFNGKLFTKRNGFNMLFMPEIDRTFKEEYPELVKLWIKKYSNTLGSLFAIIFMIVFSNSKIDVPLTNDIQDLLSGVVKENKSWTKSLHDVASKRGKKITDWFLHKKSILDNILKKIKDIIKIIKGTPVDSNKEAEK